MKSQKFQLYTFLLTLPTNIQFWSDSSSLPWCIYKSIRSLLKATRISKNITRAFFQEIFSYQLSLLKLDLQIKYHDMRPPTTRGWHLKKTFSLLREEGHWYFISNKLIHITTNNLKAICFLCKTLVLSRLVVTWHMYTNSVI